jgi:hypothetical protein
VLASAREVLLASDVEEVKEFILRQPYMCINCGVMEGTEVHRISCNGFLCASSVLGTINEGVLALLL